jgi:hypothetical protein
MAPSLASPALAPSLLAPSLLVRTTADLPKNKAPRQRGFVSSLLQSIDPATSVAPDRSVRTDAAARYHDHRRPFDHNRRPLDHHDAAIANAPAIGATMETRTAAAGSIRGAEARNGASQQNCSEKVFHFFSRLLAARRRDLDLVKET